MVGFQSRRPCWLSPGFHFGMGGRFFLRGLGDTRRGLGTPVLLARTPHKPEKGYGYTEGGADRKLQQQREISHERKLQHHMRRRKTDDFNSSAVRENRSPVPMSK